MIRTKSPTTFRTDWTATQMKGAKESCWAKRPACKEQMMLGVRGTFLQCPCMMPVSVNDVGAAAVDTAQHQTQTRRALPWICYMQPATTG